MDFLPQNKNYVIISEEINGKVRVKFGESLGVEDYQEEYRREERYAKKIIYKIVGMTEEERGEYFNKLIDFHGKPFSKIESQLENIIKELNPKKRGNIQHD